MNTDKPDLNPQDQKMKALSDQAWAMLREQQEEIRMLSRLLLASLNSNQPITLEGPSLAVATRCLLVVSGDILMRSQPDAQI